MCDHLASSHHRSEGVVIRISFVMVILLLGMMGSSTHLSWCINSYHVAGLRHYLEARVVESHYS